MSPIAIVRPGTCVSLGESRCGPALRLRLRDRDSTTNPYRARGSEGGRLQSGDRPRQHVAVIANSWISDAARSPSRECGTSAFGYGVRPARRRVLDSLDGRGCHSRLFKGNRKPYSWKAAVLPKILKRCQATRTPSPISRKSGIQPPIPLECSDSAEHWINTGVNWNQRTPFVPSSVRVERKRCRVTALQVLPAAQS